VAASAFFFSVMTLLVKVAGERLPTMQIVLVRSACVAAFSGVTAVARGRDLRGNERGLLFVRGGLGFAALSCFYYGIVHLPLAEATVIQYTNPVFTALIAAVLLSESLRARDVVPTLLGLGGVVLVARPSVLFGGIGSSLPAVPVLVALMGAVLSAGAYVTVRRLRSEATNVVVFWFAAMSLLGSLPFVVADWLPPTPAEWWVLAGVGVSTHLGQLFVTAGLQREPAGRAMTVGYLQIVFAGLWGFLAFGEIPGPWSVLGGAMVVASTLALSRTIRVRVS
jgi:drug/metabolite transporter (DMT)-like permease